MAENRQYVNSPSGDGEVTGMPTPWFRLPPRRTKPSSHRSDDQAATPAVSRFPDISYQRPYEEIRKKALASTGQWLFRDSRFLRWKSCNYSEILWLYGSIGTGKSTLTSMIIELLINGSDEHVALYPNWCFCSKDPFQPEQADPYRILHSLLQQMLDSLDEPRHRYNPTEVPSRVAKSSDVLAEEATNSIIAAVERRPVTFIPIDALDEVRDRKERGVLIKALKQILAKSKGVVKIFVTSRDDSRDVVRSMNGFPAIRVDAAANQADIDHYVRQQVQLAFDRIKQPQLVEKDETRDLQQSVVDYLCSNAAGMFLWVDLQLESLRTAYAFGDMLLEHLKKLPPALESVYEEIYYHRSSSLDEERRSRFEKTLSWLMISKEPLQTSEMWQLICAPSNVDLSVTDGLDLCGGLVRYETEKDRFMFSHDSIKLFLENKAGAFLRPSLHTMATKACLKHLSRSSYINGDSYAAVHWLNHAEDATASGCGFAIDLELQSILTKRNDLFEKWNKAMYMLYRPGRQQNKRSPESRLLQVLGKTGNPLFAAACFALPTHLRRIITEIDQPADINLTNLDGEGALYLACQHGMEENVQILIENGADVNAQGGEFRNPLQAASYNGHIEIVTRLIDAGCDIKIPDSANRHRENGAPSVRHRSYFPKGDLNDGSHVPSKIAFCTDALTAAAVGGHAKIVKLLLDRGATVDLSNEHALVAASVGGCTEVVKLLLDAGSSATVKLSRSVESLNAASSAIIKSRRSEGSLTTASPAVIKFTRSVESLAAESRRRYTGPKIFLRSAGTEDDTGGEALQAAAATGHAEIVQLLLRDGRYRVTSGAFSDALSAACHGKHTKLFRVLLQYGIGTDSRRWLSEDDFGCRIMLKHALMTGNMEMLQLMIDNDAWSNEFKKSLTAISEQGFTAIVRLLLDRGATDDWQGSALRSASEEGHIEIAKLLVEHHEIRLSLLPDTSHLKGRQYEEAVTDAPDLGDRHSINYADELSDSMDTPIVPPYSSDSIKCSVIRLFVALSLRRADLSWPLRYAASRMTEKQFIQFNACLLKIVSGESRSLAASHKEGRLTWILHQNVRRLQISTKLYSRIIKHEKLPTTQLQSQQWTFTEFKLDRLRTSLERRDHGVVLEMLESVSLKAQKDSWQRTDMFDEHEDYQFLITEIEQLFDHSDAIRSYADKLRTFLSPVISQNFHQLMQHGQSLEITELLDNAFDLVAQNDFEWLYDLVQLGQSKKEIAEMLVDVESRSPWIFSELSTTDGFPLDPWFHRTGCVYGVALHLRFTPWTLPSVHCAFPQRDHGFDLQNQNELKNQVASLCGLAGVVPSSRDLRSWDGQVNFTYNQGLVTAKVSYQKPIPTLTDQKIETLLGICGRIQNAFGLLQIRGGCCNSFTILCWSVNQVSLCTIYAADILAITEALTLLGSDGPRQLAEAAAKIIHKITLFKSTDEHPKLTNASGSDLPVDTVLHRVALALQVLCLGFLSHSRGHAGKLQLHFLDHAIDKFVLQGMLPSEQDDLQITAELVNLTCIGDLLERPVFVFGLAGQHSHPGLTQRFDLRARIQDIADVWGPVLLKVSPSLLPGRKISCVKIGGGTLKLSSTLPGFLHWDRSPDSEADMDSSEGFSLHLTYTIGFVEINRDCPLQEQATQESFWQSSIHHLSLLDTREPTWRMSTRSVQAGAGQYITISAGVQFTRIDGITVKDAVMKTFEESYFGWPTTWLNAYYGLQVSLCTRLARRVPLRTLLADVLPAYVMSHVCGKTHWADYHNVLLEALRIGHFEDLVTNPMVREHFTEIQRLLHSVLVSLRNTGVDRNGVFRIAVPRKDQQCFKLECIDANFWARILEDTEDDCATFAYITSQCLENDHVRCRGHSMSAWQDRSELLLTEVCLRPSIPPDIPSAEGLTHGTEYMIGPSSSGLVAFVNRDASSIEPTLLISHDRLKRIPEKLRKRVGLLLKKRLRERGAIGGQTIQVAVRAKGTFGTESIVCSPTASSSALMTESDDTSAPIRTSRDATSRYDTDMTSIGTSMGSYDRTLRRDKRTITSCRIVGAQTILAEVGDTRKRTRSPEETMNKRHQQQ